MKINGDQVFIIGDHELESRINNKIAIKFNEIFDSKTTIYLDSAFTGLNPYKFVALYGDPKDNGYQSIHIKANYAGINLEIQIRTACIHKHAENGSAAYDEYKNTEIQNFTKSFLYKISGNAVEQNEKLGLLKETTLDPTFWAFTPADEIPQTPDKLKTFEDMALLKKIFE